ncbi:hypothetical protein FOHLNKBM_1425 [Methylobacterium longum]|nr:hypothetical protein FOHLNKBM_1425 [Methylobacterium longum]
MMRPIFAALCLACAATAALAGEPLGDGPVAAGGFGMDGSDYYGDIHARMPFTREEAPRPIGLADIARARAARGRAVASAHTIRSAHRPPRHARPHRG